MADTNLNCLAYALRFWKRDPRYKIYYDSEHVINSKKPMLNSHFRDADTFGYNHFHTSFNGLLDDEEQQILKEYFQITSL